MYMYTMITKFFFFKISIVWHNPKNVKGIKHSIFDFILPLVTNLLKSLNWGKEQLITLVNLHKITDMYLYFKNKEKCCFSLPKNPAVHSKWKQQEYLVIFSGIVQSSCQKFPPAGQRVIPVYEISTPKALHP